MKPASRIPSERVVARAYDKAIEDEKKILKLWPHAREHKKAVTSALGFSPTAVDVLKNKGTREATIKQFGSAHREVLKEALPSLHNYRPSELIKANLHEAWVPYATLLLLAASRLAGPDFAVLSPKLAKLGFDHHILGYFRSAQGRRYFLQQTPASIATMIVLRRHPNRIGSEEAIRTAQKRIYSRARSNFAKEPCKV